MLSVVATALGIVVLVAVPNLRQGSTVLSPNGKRAVRRARQQAKKKPMAAAGGTWHGLVGIWRGVVGLKRVMVRLVRRTVGALASVGSWLHAAIDRLEAKDTETAATTSSVEREPEAERVDVPKVVGRPTAAQPKVVGQPTAAQPTVGQPTIGRPRPTPTDSGPIPAVTPDDHSHHNQSHRGRVTAGAGGSAHRSR